MIYKKKGIVEQNGSTTHEKPNSGTTSVNPLNIIKKYSNKIVLDARHLNSDTDQLYEHWPLEPLATKLARTNKKYKCAIDLMYAYAHATSDDETIKLSGF